MGQDDAVDMTNEERDLVLLVANGVTENLYKIYMFRDLCARSLKMPYLPVLRWLVKKGITGHDFREWLKTKHDDSILLMAAHVRKELFNDSKTRKIYGLNPV